MAEFPDTASGKFAMQTGLPRRFNMRLASHDYTMPGHYFITVCTARRRPILGWLESDGMHLSKPGAAVEAAWRDLLNHRDTIQLGEFVVMPDHIHGIITISDADRSGNAHRPSLGAVVSGFKSSAARQINRLRNMPGAAVWQRGYYDRIIPNETALGHVRRYIAMNPERAVDHMLSTGMLRA
jgi:REP element-mobilizing transposase RayT